MIGTTARVRGLLGRRVLLAIFASVIGELMSDIALIFLAAQLAKIATTFGPTEFFALGELASP